MNDKHVYKVSGNVTDCHKGYSHNKACSAARDLHIGHHYLREHKRRSTDYKASEIVLGKLEYLCVFGLCTCSEKRTDRIGENQHHCKPYSGHSCGYHNRGCKAGISALLVAYTHSFSAHDLNACRDHTSDSRKNKQHRRCIAVSRH